MSNKLLQAKVNVIVRHCGFWCNIYLNSFAVVVDGLFDNFFYSEAFVVVVCNCDFHFQRP